MLPDYGMMMWAEGATETVHHVLANPLSIADYGTRCEISAVIYLDENKSYVVTLSTTQPLKTLTKLMKKKQQLWLIGKLDRGAVVGGSGEHYRMLTGRVSDKLGRDAMASAS